MASWELRVEGKLLDDVSRNTEIPSDFSALFTLSIPYETV